MINERSWEAQREEVRTAQGRSDAAAAEQNRKGQYHQRACCCCHTHLHTDTRLDHQTHTNPNPAPFNS